MGEGKVLRLFDRTCFECVHFSELMDRQGVTSYCGLWDQPIDSESYEAEHCSTYERGKS